jgi:hypothetical protein
MDVITYWGAEGTFVSLLTSCSRFQEHEQEIFYFDPKFWDKKIVKRSIFWRACHWVHSRSGVERDHNFFFHFDFNFFIYTLDLKNGWTQLVGTVGSK